MIKHVKADSLGSVFTDSTLSVFTDYARDNGVTIDSIIFITCDNTDADAFGLEFKEGSKWIWTKEGLYANATYPISNSEIDAIFGAEFEDVESGGIGGSSSTVDLSNYYTKDETDTKFATVETVSSKAEASQVENLNTTFTSALAGVNAIGYETGILSTEDSNGWDNSGTTIDATYTKIGDICYITVKQAGLPANWWDVYYSLPITPADNISGICMSSLNEAIHYTTVLDYKSSGIPVLKLERQYGGQGFSGGTVSFVLMYKYK